MTKQNNLYEMITKLKAGDKVWFEEQVCDVDTYEPRTQNLFIINPRTEKSCWVAASAVTPFIPEIHDRTIRKNGIVEGEEKPKSMLDNYEDHHVVDASKKVYSKYENDEAITIDMPGVLIKIFKKPITNNGSNEKLDNNKCPSCHCLYDDKMKHGQGRNGACQCHCNHRSPGCQGY